MGDSNNNHDAPAARRSVHRYRPDDDPNFSIRDPESDDPLANDPEFKRRRAGDLVADSKDDPVLVKLAGIGALAKGREQIESLDQGAVADLRYELIDQHVSMAMKDGCSRNDAIGFAMERFKIRSPSTIETALAYMKEKREAEAARTPERFTTTPEAEAKAEAFSTNKSDVKAQAEQRFKRSFPKERGG
jgi:hypothetical protein